MATTRNGSAKAAEQGEQREVVVLWAPFQAIRRDGRGSAALFDWRRALLAKEPKQSCEEAAMMDDELRQKNAFLRDKIKEISDRHPELRDLSDEIALEQGTHVEVGTPFLERVNGKLQERARAIIERRPDLERFFEN
jgi:hypothetical protein